METMEGKADLVPATPSLAAPVKRRTLDLRLTAARALDPRLVFFAEKLKGPPQKPPGAMLDPREWITPPTGLNLVLLGTVLAVY